MEKYEALYYTPNRENYDTKEFDTLEEALDFYNQHKNDNDKVDWWITKRNEDREVIKDYIY